MKILLLLAVIGVAYAVPRPGSMGGNRIIGGEPTTVEEYPYMTNMQFGFPGLWWYQSCGGSLITETVSLSAAHCYYGDIPNVWRVVVGTSMTASGGTILEVSKLTWHPGFSRATLDNDVALVHLSTPAILSASVGLASIPGPNYILADDSSVTAIGYGSLWSGGQIPIQLHHVEIKTINQEICAERYAFLKTQPGYESWPEVTDNMLCTGILDVGGKDACTGDSGGPVAHNGNVVIGITSWGFRCGEPFFPGVNTRVNRFTDWILDNVSN